MTKICSKCKRELDEIFFNKRKDRKIGLVSSCKECMKQYRKENSNKTNEYYVINREEFLLYAKNYREENRESLAKKQREYARDHKEESAKQQREYREKNKEELRVYKKVYCRNRYQVDVEFKLVRNQRSRINSALKRNRKYGRTIKLLGCPVFWLKLHLESKLYNRKDGTTMSWENYTRKGWHIDHIRPCASFDLSDPSEQKACFHWTNLQPLWSEDNLSKSDHWDGESNPLVFP
jgi:hypothetical protein